MQDLIIFLFPIILAQVHRHDGGALHRVHNQKARSRRGRYMRYQILSAQRIRLIAELDPHSLEAHKMLSEGNRKQLRNLPFLLLPVVRLQLPKLHQRAGGKQPVAAPFIRQHLHPTPSNRQQFDGKRRVRFVHENQTADAAQRDD